MNGGIPHSCPLYDYITHLKRRGFALEGTLRNPDTRIFSMGLKNRLTDCITILFAIIGYRTKISDGNISIGFCLGWSNLFQVYQVNYIIISDVIRIFLQLNCSPCRDITHQCSSFIVKMMSTPCTWCIECILFSTIRPGVLRCHLKFLPKYPVNIQTQGRILSSPVFGIWNDKTHNDRIRLLRSGELNILPFGCQLDRTTT